MENYREFCAETGCVHYHLIERLESIENPEDNIKRELAIAKNRCEERCERTAYDFYEWFKNSWSLIP